MTNVTRWAFTSRLAFNLFTFYGPPIPEVNDDVAAVCEFNRTGNMKLDPTFICRYFFICKFVMPRFQNINFKFCHGCIMGFPMLSIFLLWKSTKSKTTHYIFLIYSHEEGWRECSGKKFWLLWKQCPHESSPWQKERPVILNSLVHEHVTLSLILPKWVSTARSIFGCCEFVICKRSGFDIQKKWLTIDLLHSCSPKCNLKGLSTMGVCECC